MKSRYRTRKRQIEKDAKIDKKDVAGMRARLERFLIPFFKHLQRSEARQNAATMVQGLLSDLKRKNTESIAYHRFGVPKTTESVFGENRLTKPVPSRRNLKRP